MATYIDTSSDDGNNIQPVYEERAYNKNAIDLDYDALALAKEGAADDALLDDNPKQRFLLGPLSVVGIVCNRMIGTGIFITPSTVVVLTQSVGANMLFWLAGAVMTIAGCIMFIEYGLTSPRYRFTDPNRPDSGAGEKRPLPRSGADLYYLKDIFKKPAYLAVCVYGISFVILGNVATNSMAFGVRVLQASGKADDGWEARAIAIAVITFTCILHGVWRMGGIYLSNVFAVAKVATLLLIFITGCLSWGGVFPRSQGAAANMTAPSAFRDSTGDLYAYAQAYLAITWTFGGFVQPNYVLGEVDNPRRNYRWPAFLSVVGVCVLFILVNIAYQLVVPAEAQKDGVDIVAEFFRLTYGANSAYAAEVAPRISAGLMAMSALGNLVVMTYTAARVKQEIAKEGILPFQKFFANNYPSGRSKPLFRFMEGNPVPVGALFLHWIVSVVLVLATARLAPLDAYRVIANLFSYLIDAFFGVILAAGVWVLRFRPGGSFAANGFRRAWLSLGAATVYGLAMAFPVVTAWVPPSAAYVEAHAPKFPWWVTGTVSLCCLALGTLWWVGFAKVGPLRNRGEQNVVRRKLLLRYIEKGDYYVLDHEVLQFRKLQCDPGAPRFYEDARMENMLPSSPYV